MNEESTQNNQMTYVHESLSLQLQPANIPHRIIAYAIDVGLITTAMYVLFFIAIIPLVVVFGGVAALEAFDASVLFIIIFVLLILAIASLFHVYFIYQEVKWGTTIGKKLFGLRVVSLDGKPLTVGQCLVRDLLRYVDAMMVFPGLIAMSCNDERKRLGDFAAGTRVIHSTHQEKKNQFLYVTQDDFWRFHDVLKPQSVPADVRETVLHKAYKTFVAKQYYPSNAFLDAQYVIASRFMDTAALARVDRLALVLFFAELCFQQQNQTI